MKVYASAEMTLTDTNDGISVTGIDRYYMASSSSSGITVDSQGWKPDPQETNPISRYHWSYEVVKYSDGAAIPSKPAIIGVYGKEGVDAVTVSLSSEAHTFAGTETRAIASSLSIDISAFKGNQKIPTSIGTITGGISGQLTHSELGRGTTNNKLVINVTSSLAQANGTLSIPIVADGRTFNKVFSWSVAFKGSPGDKGDKGDKGDTGDTGATGTGIKSSEISYVIHTNGTTAPTLGWVSTVPAPKQGRYLWTRTITTYTDNTTSTTYSVAYQATNGQQGDAGTGVSSTTVTYAQTTSGTTTPTSWSSTRPAPIKGQYLWSRTIITYTNGSSSTAYNTSYSATDGQKGDKGDTGPRGPQGPQGIQGPSGSNGQSQWVHIRYSANSNGSGMTTSPSSTTKYVGIAVTNSATAPAYTGFTWSKYVGEDGSRGPQGLPGQKGDDGTTTYTWIRYADTPTSGMNQYPDGKKYIGMAFNKTTQTESNSYSAYQWSLMPQNINIGGRNYAKGTSKEFTYARVGTYSGSLTAGGTTSQNMYTLEELGVQAGDTVTASMYVGESKEGYGGGFRIDDQSGQNVYSTYKIVKNGYVSETFTILEGTTEIRMYTTGYGQSGASAGFDLPVKELKLEKGDKATDWTPAPEDIQSQFNDFEDGIGDLYLADKTGVLSGQEIFTDKADEGGLAHVEVDGKSYQPNHITNLFTKKTVSGSTYSVNTGVVMQIIKGHKYYTRRTFTSGSTSGSYGSIRMLGVDNHNFTGNYNSGDFSQITEYTGQTRTGEVMFYGSNGTPAGGTIKNTFIIDLTGHFGAGNEPSVNEMNKLTDALGWFSGKKVYSEQISKLRTVPTPDYPIEIHDLNDFDIVSSIGRQNLIKNSQNYNYSADATNLNTNFVANLSEPLVKGQEYTFSFEIKADNPMTSSRIFINSSTIIYKEFKFDKEWSRQYVSFTYDGGYYGSVDRPIHPHIYPSGSGVKYIQNIKLEKGNVATDWTPAPEDVSENDNHSLIDKVNLLLDKPLTDVGDVKDQLFKDSDGLWKIGRKIVSEKLSNLTFTSTDPNGENSYLFDDSVAFICTLKEHISTDTSTWGNKIISSHFREVRGNNYNWNKNGGNDMPGQIGTVHQISGTEYHRIFVRVPNSTIGATMNDSLSTLNSKMAKWVRENDIDVQYHARNESVEVLPMSTQNKLNRLSSFAKSNYVYTVDDNNINPNLNVVFKSKGWKHKFATDNLETEIKDKVSTEDLTNVSNDLNTSIGDLSNTVDGKVDKSIYEEFLEHNANIQEQLSTSTANAQEDITKALARTATVEQKLGEGAADWIFTHTQIRMSDEGITLGEEGSGSYLQITNDQISFYNGSEDPVAFINGGMLNINHAIFVESIQISEFMFSSEISGHLTLRYVGN